MPLPSTVAKPCCHGFCCKGTVGVSNTDTMPLCKLRTAKTLNPLWHQHSCDSTQPDTFLAQLPSFTSQSLRAWRPYHRVQRCTVHLSHILRVIKRMYESQVQRNLQNVPCSQKKVWPSTERDTTDLLFILKTRNPAKIKITQLVWDLQPNYPPRFP